MDINLISTVLPFITLPLTAITRQLLLNRTYGSLAFLNNQAAIGKVTYNTQDPISISVIIVAHNQATQLEKNLPLILEQEYAPFEVIVINDCSTDHTEDVLKEMSLRYKNLYHTFTLPTARYISRRKLAITLGVKASKYDWIVMTEADCQPVSNQWLQLLARNCIPKIDLVLGYANYQLESTLFNQMIVIDRLLENVRFLSQVIYNDQAYRGDGCNMAFRKSAFYNKDGFLSNLALIRGEDTLLVNDLALQGRTRVECHPQSIIHQESPVRAKSWITDKVIYLETRLHLNNKGRKTIHYYTMQSILTYLCYGLTFTYLTWGVLGTNYSLLLSGLVSLLILILGSILPLYKTSKSIGERTYILSLPWHELLLPIQGLWLHLRHKFSHRDEFFRH